MFLNYKKQIERKHIMKFLFLDDSKQKIKGKNWEYVGYGGFCIDSRYLRQLECDYYDIRKKYKIPQDIELKWSPNKHHFLNKEFTGNRNALFEEIIDLLKKYHIRIICAVHDINECYRIILQKWSIEKTYLWAISEQLKFLIKTYEIHYLEDNDDIGLIIADHYGNKKGEHDLIAQSKEFIKQGTEFHRFSRICITPLTVSSKDSPFIQIADIVVGITVGSLANNRYALNLFDKISRLYLRKSDEDIKHSQFPIYELVLDYGLKLFPENFREKGNNIFKRSSDR